MRRFSLAVALDRSAAAPMFMGTGAGAGRDPEAFRARPGETPPGPPVP